MGFGLLNAPAKFEKLLETVLRDLIYESRIMYLDDIIVIGRTFQKHLLNLRKVFQQFREARLKFNPEKRQPFQKEVWYLRYMSPEVITTDPEKLKAAREWPNLKNTPVYILQTVYFRFCLHCETANHTKKEKHAFQWTPEMEAAFQTLKEVLCTVRILAYPQPREVRR
jgi:hypothetical protein